MCVREKKVSVSLHVCGHDSPLFFECEREAESVFWLCLPSLCVYTRRDANVDVCMCFSPSWLHGSSICIWEQHINTFGCVWLPSLLWDWEWKGRKLGEKHKNEFQSKKVVRALKGEWVQALIVSQEAHHRLALAGTESAVIYSDAFSVNIPHVPLFICLLVKWQERRRGWGGGHEKRQNVGRRSEEI